MNVPKINQPDINKLQADPSVKVEEEPTADKSVSPKEEPQVEFEEDSSPFKSLELKPCNWHILPIDGGISALCMDTGRSFKGTMEDFNKKLRG